MLDSDPIGQARENWLAHANGPVDQVAAATALTRARQLGASRTGGTVAALSLTFAQLEVLAILCRPDAPSLLADLSRELNLHATTVARTAARLESNGYVQRSHDEVDKRVVIIRVTPAGRDAAVKALTELTTIEFGLSGWTAAEAVRFVTLVDPIVRAQTA